MAETVTPSPYNLIPATAMTAGLLVKITAPETVGLCGAGDGAVMIGSVESDIDATMLAAGEKVAIRDRKTPEIAELVSSKANAAGVAVYTAAGGKVSDAAGGGAKIGISVNATTAADQPQRVILFADAQ